MQLYGHMLGGCDACWRRLPRSGLFVGGVCPLFGMFVGVCPLFGMFIGGICPRSCTVKTRMKYLALGLGGVMLTFLL